MCGICAAVTVLKGRGAEATGSSRGAWSPSMVPHRGAVAEEMSVQAFAMFWHVRACVMGQNEYLQAVTSGQVTGWGWAVAQGFGRSRLITGWG